MKSPFSLTILCGLAGVGCAILICAGFLLLEFAHPSRVWLALLIFVVPPVALIVTLLGLRSGKRWGWYTCHLAVLILVALAIFGLNVWPSEFPPRGASIAKGANLLGLLIGVFAAFAMYLPETRAYVKNKSTASAEVSVPVV